MIALNSNNIIARLSGNLVLVQKDRNSENPNELTDGEKRAIQELKNRDQEVRDHEASHVRNQDVLAVGGPNYTYTLGPDGKPYAVGGKVMITTGASRDPESALRKARAMRDAVLAPGEPSSQDLAAAGAAQSMEMEAIIKMAQQEKSDRDHISSLHGNTIKTSIEKYKQTNAIVSKAINPSLLSNTPDEDNHINIVA